jgi:hypothetical protein
MISCCLEITNTFVKFGPTFVHTNREANNYVNIFEGLKKLNSEFKDIQAFGSDGDLALPRLRVLPLDFENKWLSHSHIFVSYF